jgi:hypothetical protein
MKKNKVLLASLIGVLAIFVFLVFHFFPIFILNYVNNIKPGVKVQSVTIESFDCATVKNVTIDLPNIKGTIKSAFVCKRAKTIDADGGFITITIQKTKGGPSEDVFAIKAKNLSVKIIKDDKFLFLGNTVINDNLLTSSSGVFTHPNITVNIYNVKIDSNKRIITFESGNALNDNIQMFGVTFFSKEKVLAKSMILRYKGSLVKVSNPSVQYVNGMINASFGEMSIHHPMIDSKTLTIKDVKIDPFKLSEAKFANHRLTIGNISVEFNLKEQWIKSNSRCYDLLDSLPSELKIYPVNQVKLKGNLDVYLSLLPDVKFKLKNTCLIDGVTPDFINALKKPFKYMVYHPFSGKRFERISGPGSAEWVGLEFISDNMSKALTTTEDPGFFVHRGIIPKAIENSIRDNIKLEKFFRGGSTITMQLAKNLWLSRHRTLSRKIQEAILTIALESSLTKEEILELYLNVVEFGPDIYGIGAASQKIISENPMNLSLSQAVYLALRLPAPNNSASFNHMKTKIMTILSLMVSSGKISEKEFEYERDFLLERLDN